MKFTIILAAGVLVSLAGVSNAFAKDATCKVKTNDIGTIIGHGSDASAAFEDAATQCFDRYSSLSKARNRGADEEAQLSWIDTCANVKCG